MSEPKHVVMLLLAFSSKFLYVVQFYSQYGAAVEFPSDQIWNKHSLGLELIIFWWSKM